MLVSYPAVFYKYEDGSYSVIFPDFGVATQGNNLEDATRMAVDCLAGQIKWYKEDGDELPKPTLDLNLIEFDERTEDENYIEAIKQIITVDADEYAKKYFDAKVKKTLTIPKWVNDEALKLGINFSHILHEALLDEINRKKYEEYEIDKK